MIFFALCATWKICLQLQYFVHTRTYIHVYVVLSLLFLLQLNSTLLNAFEFVLKFVLKFELHAYMYVCIFTGGLFVASRCVCMETYTKTHLNIRDMFICW